MSFRSVPKSVTLNDLERRNSHNFCVISPNSIAFGTDYVKVVGVWRYTDTSCGRNVFQKNEVFTALHAMQTRSSHENSVCPSVTRVHCDALYRTKEYLA